MLAIDGDPNPNLVMALGLDAQTLGETHSTPPDSITERVEDADGKMRMILNDTVENIAAIHGIAAPDGIRLIVGTKVENAGAG